MLLHGGYNDGPDEVEVKLKSNHLGSGLSTVTNDWISWASLSLLAPGVSSGPSKCEEDRPFHRRCHCDSRNDIWNMLMREFFPKMIIPPILGLWLTLLLTLEVKKKRKNILYKTLGLLSPWGFTNPSAQVECQWLLNEQITIHQQKLSHFRYSSGTFIFYVPVFCTL